MKTPISIGGRIKLHPDEVAYFEADVNYTIVHLHSNQRLVVATNLGKIQERFESCGFFIRPQKSYLINVSYVKDFDFDTIELHNSLQVGISRRKKAYINSTLKSCLS